VVPPSLTPIASLYESSSELFVWAVSLQFPMNAVKPNSKAAFTIVFILLVFTDFIFHLSKNVPANAKKCECGFPFK
jgi:hypothetical protein